MCKKCEDELNNFFDLYKQSFEKESVWVQTEQEEIRGEPDV